MDSKVTKKRLSEFLAYEWIAIIVVAVVSIIAWEAILSFAAVKLKPGQTFTFVYDTNVRSTDKLYDKLQSGVFSYDVIGGVSFESAVYDDSVLYAKIDTDMIDAIITDSLGDETVRAKTLIDNRNIYSPVTLCEDALEYAGRFYNGDEIDKQKVAAYFLDRMRKDNRYRSDEAKAQGIEEETQRIKDVKEKAEKLLAAFAAADDRLFFRYTRFEQTYNAATGSRKDEFAALVENEKTNGREDFVYGLNAQYLTGGEHDPSEYFMLKSTETDSAENVVILLVYQKRVDGNENPLFTEAVSFLYEIVRLCGNLIA
ncbi:MAG: hypothetical protein J6W87_04015 [Clostridia bacterium]|nr:hypothetical protein [Clostridia bacterium]